MQIKRGRANETEYANVEIYERGWRFRTDENFSIAEHSV
jgi:hypothetical protein